MNTTNKVFQESEALERLRHFLPSQAPLKDFIHHNTLHAFQGKPFFQALHEASVLFGYRTRLSLRDYRKLYADGKISDDILHRILREKYHPDYVGLWRERLFHKEYPYETDSRVGKLRGAWKKTYRIDLDSLVFPTLFRLIGSYLDQGISIWSFPEVQGSFLDSVRELVKTSKVSLLSSKRAESILLDPENTLTDILTLVVGKKDWFETYLFDQQFMHKGWSGMVATLEGNPGALVEHRPVSLHDFIFVELILEINALDQTFGDNWKPVSEWYATCVNDLFKPVTETELTEVVRTWQEAYEWSFYDQVLKGIQQTGKDRFEKSGGKKFQAMFCIDDRECSMRRYLERLEPGCETYGTPGFFGIPIYYQPRDGGLLIKLCPANIEPKHVIKEQRKLETEESDPHFHKRNSSLIRGYLVSQTLGFWSALKLAGNIFRPSKTASSNSSFRHMDPESELRMEYQSDTTRDDGLREGFTLEEMTGFVSGVLKSIGLVKDFAPLVYVMSHGSSSANNTHYAGYDCGACSGRPGSVNARLFARMANHPEVRKELNALSLTIPVECWFVAGLHDTATDEVMFYDLEQMPERHKALHQNNQGAFNRALDQNAKERSRRFILTNSREDARLVHEKVKQRAFSLFEPRPEFNHATNSLCIIGRRKMSEHLFLDRRAFMNSYDPELDQDGAILTKLIKPIGPVCGGINLEYFFSRLDNPKLGAGTKLPHNVVGLIGVANGVEGDLRPGLPLQMVEIHDPIRLLVIIEQKPEIILKAIQDSNETYEWFINEWVRLCSVDPETREIKVFRQGVFTAYTTLSRELPKVESLETLFEFNEDNLPVMVMEEN